MKALFNLGIQASSKKNPPLAGIPPPFAENRKTPGILAASLAPWKLQSPGIPADAPRYTIFSWENETMNPRNRVFFILGFLLLISLVWYFFTTRSTEDLQLIGTVDANEVIVSSRIPGGSSAWPWTKASRYRRASWSPPSKARISRPRNRLRQPLRRASDTNCRCQTIPSARPAGARQAR